MYIYYVLCRVHIAKFKNVHVSSYKYYTNSIFFREKRAIILTLLPLVIMLKKTVKVKIIILIIYSI